MKQNDQKKEIVLRWTAPAPYDEIEYSNYPGFYCITSAYKGQPPKLLYIGHSYNETIKSRLSEHNTRWLDKYHGIRLSFADISRDDLQRLSEEDMLCIENVLIYLHNPMENTQGKDNLRRDLAYHCFIIKNCGHIPFGFAPTIDMKEVLLKPKLLTDRQSSYKPRKTTKKSGAKRLLVGFKHGLLK